MITININENVALKYNTSIEEILSLLIIHNKINIDSYRDILISKGYITAERDAQLQPIGWRITRLGTEILDNIILESDKHHTPQEKLIDLATRLKEIFPKGKKEGTNYYWAEGTALIIRRLQLFFKKYGNKYTNNQIITAAENYVRAFNGNYTYMKLLKYFIFKEKIGYNGEVEGDSDLITYIENSGQEDCLKEDWTSNVV